jgi:zinc transport system permease protein
MNWWLEIFEFGFMRRALLAGFLIAPLLSGLGIVSSLRNMAFFGDGMAHATLAGIAIAIIAGQATLPVAILWAVVVAIGIYLIEQKTELSTDTAIGILFTSSLAFGVILMSTTTGYQPELMSYLFGNILLLKPADIYTLLVFAVIIGGWVFFKMDNLLYSALNQDLAKVSGVRVQRDTFLLYLALAISVVLGVKVMGVILVSALLIIPAATAQLLSRSFKGYAILTLFLGWLMTILGIVISFYTDLPSGAVIILLGTGFFLFANFVKFIKK